MARSDLSARNAQYVNNESVQGAICIAAPSVTYLSNSISASTDPFSSKTNKYAESQFVYFVGLAAFHVRFGNSSVGSATTSDFYVPANTPMLFAVDFDRPYMRIIPNTGSASAFVTEIY